MCHGHLSLCASRGLFSCPSNDSCFMLSVACCHREVSSSHYCLCVVMCPGQRNGGSGTANFLSGFPHSCYTHGCISKCNCSCSTSGWHGLLDSLPDARLGVLVVSPSVVGELEVITRTAISVAFKQSCLPGSGSPCWAYSFVK